MKTIYVDNFRSFSDTYIPLENVNFLIGENSTGKTSLLSLIYLISDARFWFGDFGNNEVDLGYFSDIVNIDSKKRYFWIGWFDEKNASFIKYIDDENIPTIAEAKFFSKDGILEVVIEKEVIKYRNICKDIIYTHKNFNYKDYLHKLKSLDEKWETLKSDSIRKRQGKVPFAVILNLVENKIAKETKKRWSMGMIIDDFLYDSNWIAPIRAKAKKTYDSYRVKHSAEGDHIPYRINNILSNTASEYAITLLDKVKDFGKNSGLFELIITERYGKENTSPFALKIKSHGLTLNILNVGYGVSQIIPIIFEVLSGGKNSWFSIQQPEVHLHPKAQAALGDFFYSAAVENKNFIIETHSDYIIDRFRNNIKNNPQKIKSQILFFEKKGSKNCVSVISIDKNGRYSKDQPDSFKEFFICEELMKLNI